MSLQFLPIFRGIPDDQLDWARKYFNEVRVNYGTRLIEEGEQDASMILVIEGQLEMTTGGVLLGTANPGDLVGEVALFGHGVRSASVEALTISRLLILDRNGYVMLRNCDSPIAHAIEGRALELVTKRLRSVYKRISELAEGTPAEHVTPSAGFFSKVASLFGAGGLGAGPRGLDKVAALTVSSLFKTASDSALVGLAAHFSTATASPGTFICTEGEPGGEMFIIVSGTVDILVETDDDFVEPLATLEAGEAFGMGALVEQDQPRMASCVARESTELLTMGRETWTELSNSDNLSGSLLRTAMVSCLAEQLAFANGQLAMLDISRQMRQLTGERLSPLLKASAGVEAHGRHLGETGG